MEDARENQEMLGRLVRPEIEEMIQSRDYRNLRRSVADWTPTELAELMRSLPSGEDVILFRLLPRASATRVFEFLDSDQQQDLLESIAKNKTRLADLLNEMSPDDRTALLEELPAPVTQRLLGLLSPSERRVADALLGYPEYSIGRLMTPDYVAVLPEWTLHQALDHIRRYGSDSETLNVIYVVDREFHLIDDLRMREVILTDPDSKIEDLIDRRFISLQATDPQEEAIRVFKNSDRTALPVTDSQGALLGIVTIDDVLDVAEEEATEDIQMIGGSEALDDPYLSTPVGTLMQKRVRWLIVLFLGQMLTTTAMAHYADYIAQAVVLALFLPLIISSGGNSGSQTAALIVRAMAVGEVRLRDWWRVFQREIVSGLCLGAILGAIGLLRVYLWEHMFGSYGEHWFRIGLTVGSALVGVVMLGTVFGAMLPFIMRRLGADPATSSTPFVATLVDVAGVFLYFSVAAWLLTGTLL